MTELSLLNTRCPNFQDPRRQQTQISQKGDIEAGDDIYIITPPIRDIGLQSEGLEGRQLEVQPPGLEQRTHVTKKLFRGKPIPQPTRSSSRLKAQGETVYKSTDSVHTANFISEKLDISNTPQTLQEALQTSDSAQWQKAVDLELQSLANNHTWDEVDRPNNQSIIGCRWVFKLKDNGVYKARLVAQGFSQIYGVDYFETYAPVARFASIRMVLALAARFGLNIHQMDVDTAFLYGQLEEELYMELPPGYRTENKVCRLRKSLYGLKQAPRVWNQVLDAFFFQLGLIKSVADSSVYYEKDPQTSKLPLLVVIYIDDLIIVHRDMAKINKVKEALNSRFNMKDLGQVRNLLGMEVHFCKDGSIFVNQASYIKKLLQQWKMEDCKPADTPMAAKLAGSQEDFDLNLYQKLTGGLMWPSLISRPEIAFSVAYLARWNHSPCQYHHQAQKRVLRYLRGTIGHGILFKAKSDMKLLGFTDADWAGDITDRKSTSGNVFMLYEGPITWSSIKQKTVATSSVESEYVALATATKEALWILTWLKEIGIDITTIPINIDSQGALNFANNGQFSQRTKHIDIKHHFIWDHLKNKDIKLQYLGTEDMIADAFTKPLERIKFEKFKDRNGGGQSEGSRAARSVCANL